MSPSNRNWKGDQSEEKKISHTKKGGRWERMSFRAGPGSDFHREKEGKTKRVPGENEFELEMRPTLQATKGILRIGFRAHNQAVIALSRSLA